MRARRMRRRIFNLFAFALLAFAVCLIAFSKEEPLKQTGETAQVMNNAATIAATR